MVGWTAGRTRDRGARDGRRTPARWRPRGAQVVIGDAEAEGAASPTSSVTAPASPRLTSPTKTVASGVRLAEDAFDRSRSLVNNAGAGRAPIAELALEEWRRVSTPTHWRVPGHEARAPVDAAPAAGRSSTSARWRRISRSRRLRLHRLEMGAARADGRRAEFGPPTSGSTSITPGMIMTPMTRRRRRYDAVGTRSDPAMVWGRWRRRCAHPRRDAARLSSVDADPRRDPRGD